MIPEIGVALSIEPSTIIEIGKVAQQAFDAKDCPARPPMVKIMGICAPRNAWARTRTITFRLARPSWGAAVMVSLMAETSANLYTCCIQI